MYEVVGCTSCRALWIRSGDAETAQCPRCQRTHSVEGLRALAKAESAEAARDARSRLLAERAGQDGTNIAGFAETAGAADAAGVSDESYLAGHGIDPDAVEPAEKPVRRNRKETVRFAIETAEEATHARIISIAEAHGIAPDDTEACLETLVRAGEVTVSNDQYRVL